MIRKIFYIFIEEAWLWYEAILQLVPGKIGMLLRSIAYKPFFKEIKITSQIREFSHIWYPWNISIKQNSRIGRGSNINGYGGIKIGKYVRMGPSVMITSTNHIYNSDNIPIKNQGIKRDSVEICDDVWIGGHVSILAGVTIGKGTIIGAGAVVTKDIPEFSIATGIPATVKKRY